jgi:hypothetical protein
MARGHGSRGAAADVGSGGVWLNAMRFHRQLVVVLAGALPLGAGLADVVIPAEATPYRPPQPPVSHTEPLPIVPRAERAAHFLRVVEQQNEVMARLAPLGAIETARVQHLRNAIAIRISADMLERARAIDGVKAVRIVRHLQRSKP